MQGCKAHLCCFPTGRAQPPVGAWSWVGIGHWGPQGEPGGAAHPTASLILSSLCPDITGPIILQTYRAIADYEKSSGTEMALATGDVVDVVEKGESGQPPACPARTSLPHCLGLWPQAPSPKALPSRQPRASSLPGPGALAVPPTLQVTVSERAPWGGRSICTYILQASLCISEGQFPGGQARSSSCV